eukprot:1142638-Pelagomonas_calceolata.AAC.9
MLDENVSPAADQPDYWAVGQDNGALILGILFFLIGMENAFTGFVQTLPKKKATDAITGRSQKLCNAMSKSKIPLSCWQQKSCMHSLSLVKSYAIANSHTSSQLSNFFSKVRNCHIFYVGANFFDGGKALYRQCNYRGVAAATEEAAAGVAEGPRPTNAGMTLLKKLRIREAIWSQCCLVRRPSGEAAIAGTKETLKYP